MTDDQTPAPDLTKEKSGGITRRHLLGIGLAGGAAAAAAALGVEWQHGSTPPARRSTTPESTASSSSTTSEPSAGTASDTDGILVVLTLYGGNDGLNTLIPISDSAYTAARPTLGYSSADVLTIADGLAFHPNLHNLKKLWDQRQLAVVRGVGYPQPNRSHFRSMDIWQSAVPDRVELTGWLGRWLDTLPADPMIALALGSTVPRAFIGATNTASAVPNATLTLPGSPALLSTYKMLVAGQTTDRLSARVCQSGRDLLTLQRELGVILAQSAAADAGAITNNLESPGSTTPATSAPAKSIPLATLPANNPLAAQLEIVARTIEGHAPTRIYGVSLGGFDTHAQEKANHARLMTQLDDALGWFFQRLAPMPTGRNVVLMAHSEFGRRVAENASGGTDHGTAAPVFIVGSRVRSGFHGDQPRLTNLDSGDLVFTTDFRTVYASMLQQVLNTDSDRILGGNFDPLPLVS